MIKAYTNISKKTFKKAIGALYKKKLVSLDTSGISLAGGEQKAAAAHTVAANDTRTRERR